jgi:hypothetical protein
LKRIPLERVGTDPAQAVNFAFRTARFPPLEENEPEVTLSASMGLRLITEKIRKKAYESLTSEERIQWDRYRNHSINLPDNQVVEAPLAYRPRPHNGIWATPPYLHNGSVPTLMQLLSPVQEREPEFYVGSTLYDPVEVGLADRKNKSYTKFDTTISGNRNIGHEFRNLTLMELESSFGLQDVKSAPTGSARWASLLGITEDDYNQLTKEDIVLAQRNLTEAVLRVRDASDLANRQHAKEYGTQPLGKEIEMKLLDYAEMDGTDRARIRMRATYNFKAGNESPKADTAVAPNVGHTSFPGVIGPLLSPNEKSAIIEFMKSL